MYEKFIEEILESIYAEESIIKILYKCRTVAQHFNDTLILGWIDNELKGYKKREELPEYRTHNPFLLYEEGIWYDNIIGVRKNFDKTIFVKESPLEIDIKTIFDNRDDNLKIELPVEVEGKWISGK